MNKHQHREWRDHVMFHAALTQAQCHVLLALATFADYPSGTNAFPGLDQLAEKCHCNERTVRRALERGVELGLIERTEKGKYRSGHADVYRLLPIVIGGHQSPPIEASSVDISDRIGGHQSPSSLDTGVHTPIPSTNPLTPERTPSSLRSDGVRELPRRSAPGPTTEKELTDYANHFLDRYVDGQNRLGNARRVEFGGLKTAAGLRLPKSRIISDIQEWQSVPRPSSYDLCKRLEASCRELGLL